jgi:hypothetical protein
MRARFWWGSPKERDCLEDLRVDRDNIKMGVKVTGWDGMEWRHVSQYTDRCRGVVNKVMHIRILSDVGNFLNS